MENDFICHSIVEVLASFNTNPQRRHGHMLIMLSLLTGMYGIPGGLAYSLVS